VTRADAVFVGTLVSHVVNVDHKARELMASPDPAVAWRAFRNDSIQSVWTFQVSRVYKGAVGQRQEIITPPGAPGGSNCSGVGGAPASGHAAIGGVRVQLGGSQVPTPTRPVRLQPVQWITAAGRRWRTGPWWAASSCAWRAEQVMVAG
jgi:hypothetical protein